MSVHVFVAAHVYYNVAFGSNDSPQQTAELLTVCYTVVSHVFNLLNLYFLLVKCTNYRIMPNYYSVNLYLFYIQCYHFHDVHCRQVTQLLSDIVYFVAYQENDGRDPFKVQLTHSDRERPKLLREQNVLKQVDFFNQKY